MQTATLLLFPLFRKWTLCRGRASCVALVHLGCGAHPHCLVSGDGGLICTQIDGSQAQRVARLLYITSALLSSPLLLCFSLFYSLIQFRSLSSGRMRKTLTARRGIQASERSCAYSHSRTCTYITHSGAPWDVWLAQFWRERLPAARSSLRSGFFSRQSRRQRKEELRSEFKARQLGCTWSKIKVLVGSLARTAHDNWSALAALIHEEAFPPNSDVSPIFCSALSQWVTFSNPMKQSWVSQSDRIPPSTNTMEAYDSKLFRQRKWHIACLHTACIASPRCLEDSASQFEQKWWCEHYVFS